MLIIKNRIRLCRRDSSITQEELALAVGVSRQSIISLESGKCLPSVPLAYAIARYFNAPLENLFTVEYKNQPQKLEEVMPHDLEMRPFHGATTIHEAIDRMFDETISSMRRADTSSLSVDLSQNDKELIVEADLPGMTEDDIDIEITDGVLTIKGERKFEKSDKQKEYLYREVNYGQFSRFLTLPCEVVANKTEATVKHGHLTIVIPKAIPEAAKTHRLKPKSGE